MTVSELLRAAMVRYDLDEGLPDSLFNAKPDAAPAPVENAIKVGDTVRILADDKYNGRAGTVFSIMPGAIPVYSVRVWGGETTDYWEPDLDLISD